MSVFQLQEWWTVQLSQTEEFDSGCLAIGNVDNSNPATDKIVVGSQQGILRIYSPSRPQYRVEDLYLEESLGLPILQVLIGLFIPSAETLFGLAVLHPKKLVVFEVVGEGMKDNRPASYYSLRKCYEHNLGLDGKHFTAYNMICGPFGGARGRDMILVQSLDGKLQIFEQSAMAFTRQLVDCLVPSPISYLPKMDSFVATTYACQAECYRYQVLASSQTEIGGASQATTGAFGLTALRSALVEWRLNLGEACVQLIEGNFSGSESTRNCGELLVLCEKSLYLLKATGGIVQQRRLDSRPVCIAAYYPGGQKGPQNFMLADEQGTIQIFSQFNLVWATKISSPPVQLGVGNFGSLKGLIVSVDDSGRLSVGYLGTKPPASSVVTHARELDYDKVDEEHRNLLKIIRESQSDSKAEPKEKLFLRTQLSRTFDRDTVGVDMPLDAASINTSAINGAGDFKHVKICIRLYVSLTGQTLGCVFCQPVLALATGNSSATDVTIVVSTPQFVVPVPKTIVLQKVSGSQSTPTMVKIYLFATQRFLPSGLESQIVASYISSTGEPRVSTLNLSLPLHLACRPRPAQKTGLYKFTLDTEQAAQPLTDLFDDMLYAYQDLGLDVQEALGPSATQAMGFQFWAGGILSAGADSDTSASSSASTGAATPALVSVVVSKTAGRYRVQSDCLPALFCIISELSRLLTERLQSLQLENKGIHVTCSDGLPLDEYFAAIVTHFKIRQSIQDQLSQLNDSSHQFRMIEKRLLVRFKDRNPTPLGGLDILMKETYRRLLQLGDSVQELQTRLCGAANDLACVSRLVLTVLALKFGLTSAELRSLESYFCVDCIDSMEQGWEEVVDLSLTYLLKTALAKTAKETVSLTSTSLEMPNDVETLKKRIGMVVDRISKGVRLVAPSSASI